MSSPRVEDILPLAPLQGGLLFHSLYESGSTGLYLTQTAVTLVGRLDQGTLALAHVITGYATWHYDRVLMNGHIVGVSRYTGYAYNERALLSLGMVDVDVPIGSEVTLIWGENDGGSRRPVVERHRPVEIRAVVSPCPYSELTRTLYKA